MSEMSFSPADFAACCGNNGNNQWNNPMWLIWAILFGRNGGFFGNNGEGLQTAEIQGKLNALSQQIADNQNSNMLNSGIQSNHDYLHDFNNAVNMGFAGTNATINQASMNNLMGQKDAAAQMASCCCDIKSNILNQTNQLQSRIDQLANGTQQGFASIGYAMAQQTNELNTNATANTQRILDFMCNAETQNLRDKLAQASQDAQTATIVGQLKSSCGCN